MGCLQLNDSSGRFDLQTSTMPMPSFPIADWHGHLESRNIQTSIRLPQIVFKHNNLIINISEPEPFSWFLNKCLVDLNHKVYANFRESITKDAAKRFEKL